MRDEGEMCKRGRVSVCMATYNGSEFVREQLESILSQLDPSDEVIVLDDASTDGTLDVVASVADSRVHLHGCLTNSGHVKAFEQAISLASGSVILLADQDDVWPDGRVELMVKALARRPVVAGNLTAFGHESDPKSMRPLLAMHSGARLRNLAGILAGRRAYFGCAMAFRSQLRSVLLPIPDYVEAHDHWLAMVGNVCGGVEHIEQSVVCRRIHSANLTARARRPALRVLLSRLRMIRAVGEAFRRRHTSLESPMHEVCT